VLFKIHAFLQNPKITEAQVKDTKVRLKGTFTVFGIYLLGSIMVIILLGIIDSLIIKISGHSILGQLKLTNREVIRSFGSYSFLFIIFIGPLLEEIIFRLPLKLEKYSIGLSVGLVCYRLLVDRLLVFDSTNVLSYAKVGLFVVIVFLIGRFTPTSLLAVLKRRYSYTFYTISILFPLVHLSNFSYFKVMLLLFIHFLLCHTF
jgi:hypothetical protein